MYRHAGLWQIRSACKFFLHAYWLKHQSLLSISILQCCDKGGDAGVLAPSHSEFPPHLLELSAKLVARL